ncbi:sigma-54-dependent transcriptional regulator [Thermovenabulum gondwanense]|uniref:Stage 0 sporulation protein A homolog n=1 Tax=Thermovenabulum gondwanense TaxID=520767 RepID=A0A162MQU7_9FIRM|nr:sigma-54 dependent transcriptional regulator [Thermovenabulum gondwanense]KYO66969.1 Transcriptional regulatory protein ZraR [Thermovenabulum gondwanense]
MKAKKILIIDDEPAICKALQISLKSEGFEVDTAFSAKEGIKKFKGFLPDVVILDLRLPDSDGIKVMESIKAIERDTIVILITAYGDTKTAVEAVKKGAYDFITKPFDLEELKITLKKALKEKALLEENHILKSLQGKSAFITKDNEILNFFSQIENMANTDCPILIEGETGTGKEVMAKMIHESSDRRTKPFIPINCSAIPANLFESELFGYEKNAFTGATERKKGLIELADGGTLFLDEVGEIPLELQAKLLRFLEEKAIRRVGGLNYIPVDVRIISATNRNLKEEIERGNFRRDLYYRLCVVNFKIPPLRERKEDILPISEHFLKVFNTQFNKNIKGFTEKAKEIFLDYSWPGNVRELRNIIERAVIIARGEYITEKELPLEMRGSIDDIVLEKYPKTDVIPLEELEKYHIKLALEKTGGNISKAAKLLGISRFALQRRIKKYFESD